MCIPVIISPLLWRYCRYGRMRSLAAVQHQRKGLPACVIQHMAVYIVAISLLLLLTVDGTERWKTLPAHRRVGRKGISTSLYITVSHQECVTCVLLSRFLGFYLCHVLCFCLCLSCSSGTILIIIIIIIILLHHSLPTIDCTDWISYKNFKKL